MWVPAIFEISFYDVIHKKIYFLNGNIEIKNKAAKTRGKQAKYERLFS